MAINIIVEDGTIVPDANSYASIQTVRDYAAQRGVSFDQSDDVVAVLIIKSMDYLEARNWLGVKTDPSQSLSWPRHMAPHYLPDPNDHTIPKNLVKALCALCLLVSEDVELMPNSDGAPLIELKVGPIDQKWAAPGNSGRTPTFPLIDSLLQGLADIGAPYGGMANIRITR